MSRAEIGYSHNCVNDVFAILSKWPMANTHSSTLNFNKTNLMRFCTKRKPCINVNLKYDNNPVEEVETNEFLRLQIDNSINMRRLKGYVIHKVISACFDMREVTSLMEAETLRSVEGKFTGEQRIISSPRENRWINCML
jgi:hypothetical protein